MNKPPTDDLILKGRGTPLTMEEKKKVIEEVQRRREQTDRDSKVDSRTLETEFNF